MKPFGLKKHVNLRNYYFDYSMWMLSFGEVQNEIKSVSGINYTTLQCHFSNQDGH